MRARRVNMSGQRDYDCLKLAELPALLQRLSTDEPATPRHDRTIDHRERFWDRGERSIPPIRDNFPKSWKGFSENRE